ncbi:MAG: reverse transcriptase-like protein [Propionibacteriaceae bacterium]|jgi:probable phosphoglycerate mutase|nr:reverse transcriptase-like protein [Propionibacteriaceae bacterium]
MRVACPHCGGTFDVDTEPDLLSSLPPEPAASGTQAAADAADDGWAFSSDAVSLWDEDPDHNLGTSASAGEQSTNPQPAAARWTNPPKVLIVRADGGSRGNPGPAAYGALVEMLDGTVLNEEGKTIGTTTNNVAEYNGLIAGLEMAAAINPAAEVRVMMDSKLVVEQMSGRWKIKHPDMRPLALKARSLVPKHVSFTWVPRAQNKAADALVNKALDGEPVERK